MPTPLLSNFTPSLMSPETLERIFVQREEIAKDLVDRIILSATTPAKHHSLLIGARGMGKTHLVSLVYYRLQQHHELDDKLIVAWLREDEWGIDSWLDLVVRIFRSLEETKLDTKGLLAQLQRVSISDAETLATQLLTELIGEKTLLLIVENLDDMFAGLGEKGQQKFRSFLQERQCCTILATTPALFAGVQDRSEPFFGFFNPIPLLPLSWEEATVMLQKIAELDGQADLANFLQTPAGKARIRAVHHLAGGNPRVYTLFAQFITRESLDELVQAFMKMLDDLTPYYQSRMKELSNQQRKIIEFLVDRREAVMVKEIATQCFVEQRVVSGQLRELRNKGYVVARANGRESFYELTEVLMRLCMEVKKYRGQWVELFVDFLRIWYRPAERQEKLAMFLDNCRFISNEDLKFALESDDDPLLLRTVRHFQNCLEQKDQKLAIQVLTELQGIGGISMSKSQQISELINAGKFNEVTVILDRTVDLDSNNVEELFVEGVILWDAEKLSEALVVFDRVLAIEPDNADAFYLQGCLLRNLGRYEEALSSYDSAIKISNHYYKAWFLKGILLAMMDKYEEAIESYNNALEIKEDYHEAWFNLGIVQNILCKHNEAIHSYDKALEIKPEDQGAWFVRGISLTMLDRYDDAINSYEQAIKFKPDNHESWHRKGFTFYKWGRYPEAFNAYNYAIKINPNYYPSLYDKGLVYFHLGDYVEALASWKQAFEIIQKIKPSDTSDLIQGFLNHELLPKYQEPKVRKFLSQLLEIYTTFQVLTELGTALVRTLKQILAPDISDYTAQQWLALWQELLGDKPEMQLPFRLMTTAIAYKQHPERKERLWLGLASEERSILDEALEF